MSNEEPSEKVAAITGDGDYAIVGLSREEVSLVLGYLQGTRASDNTEWISTDMEGDTDE